MIPPKKFMLLLKKSVNTNVKIRLIFINNDSSLFKWALMSVCFDAPYNKDR